MNLSSKEIGGYRRDVDGLRGIAVLSVVIYHLDPNWLPGGFIGVDMFFVISGFLITRIIVRQYCANSFSYLEFYRRRIKRILPVLGVVILATLFVAQFVFTPQDFRELSFSAIASQLSFSNIYFTYFLDTSYFSKDSALQPLLHTWSLGVEEQFYIIYPLVLITILKNIGLDKTLVFLFVVFFISLYFSQEVFTKSATYSYYMLPSRAFELVFGGIISMLPNCQIQKNHFKSSVCSHSGLVLVLLSLFFMSETMHFPGFNALPVIIGVAILLYFGKYETCWIQRVLKSSPLVLVGLISYSLYLWHWPVVSILKYIFVEISLLGKFISFILMFSLSCLSYYFIEKPFRQDDGSFRVILRKDFLLPTLVIGILVAFIQLTSGLGIYKFNQEYLEKYNHMPTTELQISDYEQICQKSLITKEDALNEKCISGNSSLTNTLLWGDSKASNYVGALTEVGKHYGFSFRHLSHSACPPSLFDSAEYVVWKFRESNCKESNAVAKEILSQYDNLLIAASWDDYITSNSEYLSVLEKTLRILKLEGKRITLLGDMPETGKFDKNCHLKKLKLKYINCDHAEPEYTQEINEKNLKIKLLANAVGVDYFDFTSELCPTDICINFFDDSYMYFDSSHLSYTGSQLVGQWYLKGNRDISPFDQILD